MRYVVRVLVMNAAGTTQRSFTIELDHRVRPLLREYVHPTTFSQLRSVAGNK